MWKTFNLRCLNKLFANRSSGKSEQSSLVPVIHKSALYQTGSFGYEHRSKNDQGHGQNETCHETEQILHSSASLLETLSWVGTAFTIGINWKLVSKEDLWKSKLCIPSIFPKKQNLEQTKLNWLLWRYAFAMPKNGTMGSTGTTKFALPITRTQSERTIENKAECDIPVTPKPLRQNPRKSATTQKALNVVDASKELENAMVEYFSHLETLAGLQAMKTENKKKGFKHFKEGSKLGNPKANFNLGVCYETGLGTEIDLVKAAQHYQMASDAGHNLAMYNLGIFYLEGLGGLPKDPERGLSLITRAAENSVTQAQTYMGLHYAQLKKWDLAFPFIRKASIKDPEAQYYLGKCYENGLGVKPDLKKAEQLYSKAKVAGFTKETETINNQNKIHCQEKIPPVETNRQDLTRCNSSFDLKGPKYFDDILSGLHKTSKSSRPLFWIGDYEEDFIDDIVSS